ncbi:CHAT domain-containing protein [Kitasatospora sp. NPDC057692]|uniref:CHAT domain-containing protein n=1 Tax=Kitasatospora sp. NPDC057692 TaxID=3346215 RepID=UPI0036865407
MSRERRLALGWEWDNLLARVRKLDGFGDFLRPPRLASLLPAAAGGPVAMVNVSRWRCDAFLVTVDGVEPVPLPGLRAEDVVARANAFLDSIGAAQLAGDHYRRVRYRFTSGDRTAASFQEHHRARSAAAAARAAMEATLDATMRWLWDVLAEPVLRALPRSAPPDGDGRQPRLWWCPTGPLTVLPLHAAGHHEAPGGAVLDHVVSSYTPTLQALLRPGADALAATDPGAEDRMLIVAVSESDGQVLPSAAGEAERLRALFPGSRSTLLADGDATPERVLHELTRHRSVHFSCHGEQDFAAPSRGGLLVNGGRVTVADIASRVHDGVFAFLPACKTATGGTALADEMISLASALRYQGYRHVLATLWSVYDSAAVRVVDDVYAELTGTGEFVPDRAAYALHQAVLRLRAEPGARPSTWAPFIHVGA